MNLLKIFIATLLLGTLACVTTILFSYSTYYSLIPRSLEGNSDEEEVFASSSVMSADSDVIPKRPTNTDHKNDNPKEFSLRELQQNNERKPTKPQVEQNIPRNTNTKPSDQIREHSQNLNNDTNSRSKTERDSKTIQLNNKTETRTTDLQIHKPKEQCELRKNIVLLKTHKTGSSTLQNILYRFGDVRGLSFVLPAIDVYMGNPAYFHPKYVLQTPGGYNILANHARFHKENMDRIMPANTKYISILRYPPKQFESMYSYYTFKDRYHTSLEGFASNAEVLYAKHEGKNPRHSGLNPVLYDLGLPRKDLATPSKIDHYINFISDSFDLILIAEYLKESLILFKELMCWSMEDIVYFSSNKRDNSLVKEIPKQTEKQLLTWHAGDYKLYLHFNITLHRRIEEYGVQRMQNDVAILNKMIDDYKDDCVQGTKKVDELHGKTVIERYVLNPNAKNKRTCARMTYAAYDYLMMLKQKQKLRRRGNKRNL